ARRPRPEAIDEDPAAIVIRRPAPRRRIDPRPAVVRIPDPPAGAVGHPSRWNVFGNPDLPVRRHDAPVAVVVEIVDTVDRGGDVAGAHAMEKMLGARVIPLTPDVELRSDVRLDGRVRRAAENDFFTGGDHDGLPAGRRHGGPPASSRDERGLSRLDVHAVVASTV